MVTQMPLLPAGRCRPWLLALALLLLGAPAAQAQGHVVKLQLDSLDQMVAEFGMRPVHPRVSGTARDEGSVTFTRRLSAGGRYMIAGVCDADCSDLDLEVRGPNGQNVGADVEADDAPMVAFEATTTGDYTIEVQMASCSTSVCEFGVSILGGGTTTSAGSPGASGPASSSASSCSPTSTRRSVALGQSVSGRLTSSSCTRADDSYAEYFRLAVPDRASVTITLRSDDFDAYLGILDARGESIDTDDDGAGGTDSRITKTLDAGTYYVMANTLSDGETGAFTLTTSVGAAATTCTIDRPRSTVALGQTVRGSLSSSSCRRGDDSHADVYRLVVSSAQTVAITMRSDDFDAFLVLQDARGDEVESDDDGAGDTDSRISLRLQPGTYFIVANSLSSGETGAYTLEVARD